MKSNKAKKRKSRMAQIELGVLVVPKHATIAWMAVLNRLPIKDRIKSWGLEVDGVCMLCGGAEETRDHLFYFKAALGKKYWSSVAIQGESQIGVESFSGRYKNAKGRLWFQSS